MNERMNYLQQYFDKVFLGGKAFFRVNGDRDGEDEAVLWIIVHFYFRNGSQPLLLHLSQENHSVLVGSLTCFASVNGVCAQ
jgi:hypothetical protein